MKISADKNPPAYHASAHMCRVWLEGVERKSVVAADEEGRHAVLHRLDDQGRICVKDGEIVTEDFYGHVRIECPDWLREQIEHPLSTLPLAEYP